MRDRNNDHSCSRTVVALAILIPATLLGFAGSGRGDDGASDARGAGYDLSWHTIDGGGVMFSAGAGGLFELSGTIGQPDAGGAMIAGDFELTGGFWFAATGACVVESVFPPSCAIDARQPFNPDGSSPGGWSSVDFTFAAGCDVSSVGSGDFSSTLPIDDVVVDGNTVTLHFASTIPVGEWTCIEHSSTGTNSCWGWLPADVNGDGTSSAGDILAVIDNLNGRIEPPLEERQCDIDRSRLCSSADILRVIDLLNGAGLFEPWNGQRLGTCPSGR